MKKIIKWFIGIVSGIIILAVISFLIGLFTQLNYLESFRIVLGSVYVLFLPGFLISFIFFSQNAIDWIERIALSFALSIAIVPLFVFYLNLAGLKISAINTFFTILGIIVISGVILLWKSWKNKKKL